MVSRTTTIFLFCLFGVFFLFLLRFHLESDRYPTLPAEFSQTLRVALKIIFSYKPHGRQSGKSNSGLYAITGFRTPHIIFQRILSVKGTFSDSYGQTYTYTWGKKVQNSLEIWNY